MKILYVGQYSEGTTSKMRADSICKILEPAKFKVIDTHIPFYRTTGLLRSFGFRYKKGPLINKVNHFIISELENENSNSHYDLIWVDKAVFITKETTLYLSNLTSKLIHFTPDPSFTFHKSEHFLESIQLYDFVITTKSYEMEYYIKYTDEQKVILSTQGFDKEIHTKGSSSENKSGFVFIGHHEKEREEIIQLILDNGIPVKLAGIKWEKFAKKNRRNKYLTYLGKGIYGQDYVRTIAESKIAWGAISKWVPELHTTRTFEIPACGTALLTERNKETTTFFGEDEAIFYDTTGELINKVKHYYNHQEQLEEITAKAYKKVHQKGL